ncbi:MULTISPECIES: hypothetical protein [unclassified Streptomyces]|uniref:hypothetical protein n=1 Tax=unclassified Streptomyces TaxID=2593676 RepID=UPI002E378FF6|nr:MULTISPECIES: hypothetical protein [unclassified Streptomyces]WUC67980.1 hypothetical protein OG861_29180 [Streptomyces sp. NBC_00539]
MTLKEGQRVALAVDIGLADAVVMAEGAAAGPVAGFLALAAGTGGTVDRVVEERDPGREVREYERLKSLLDSFGHDMPPESRRQLEEEVRSLEPAWAAHQERGAGVMVRVRFDNGFVLDGARDDLFTSA